jgi:hypothetical protein
MGSRCICGRCDVSVTGGAGRIGNTNPHDSGTGRIVFGRGTGDVFAVPFSLTSRNVLGPLVRSREDIGSAQAERLVRPLLRL